MNVVINKLRLIQGLPLTLSAEILDTRCRTVKSHMQNVYVWESYDTFYIPFLSPFVFTPEVSVYVPHTYKIKERICFQNNSLTFTKEKQQ